MLGRSISKWLCGHPAVVSVSVSLSQDLAFSNDSMPYLCSAHHNQPGSWIQWGRRLYEVHSGWCRSCHYCRRQAACEVCIAETDGQENVYAAMQARTCRVTHHQQRWSTYITRAWGAPISPGLGNPSSGHHQWLYSTWYSSSILSSPRPSVYPGPVPTFKYTNPLLWLKYLYCMYPQWNSTKRLCFREMMKSPGILPHEWK